MRAQAAVAMSLLFGVPGLTACSSTSEPEKVTAAAPTAPAPPPAAGVVSGAIGQPLGEKDRAAAIVAQQEAVSSGSRKSWRGEKGAYGFVIPGAENGSCRDYTHRIFVNGRPQEAKGQACRENGEWRVIS